MGHGMVLEMKDHERSLVVTMAWIGNVLEKARENLVEREEAGDGSPALGDAHGHAVALLARSPPFGLGLLGIGLEGSLGVYSAFRPRMVVMKASWPFEGLCRMPMTWVARPGMVYLDESHDWLRAEMASGYGVGWVEVYSTLLWSPTAVPIVGFALRWPVARTHSRKCKWLWLHEAMMKRDGMPNRIICSPAR